MHQLENFLTHVIANAYAPEAVVLGEEKVDEGN